jgi:N-acyl-D-amino-acid deacylase
MGIRDRGLLRKGFKADLVIFDPDTVRDNATYLEPHQFSSGITWVLVNGKTAIQSGKPTSALSGRVLLRTESEGTR